MFLKKKKKLKYFDFKMQSLGMTSITSQKVSESLMHFYRE